MGTLSSVLSATVIALPFEMIILGQGVVCVCAEEMRYLLWLRVIGLGLNLNFIVV